MTSGSWGCPHEIEGQCGKVNNIPCDPGMKGCELYGRYTFFDGSKNERLREKQARAASSRAVENAQDAPPKPDNPDPASSPGD